MSEWNDGEDVLGDVKRAKDIVDNDTGVMPRKTCPTCKGTGRGLRPSYCKSALHGDPFHVETPIGIICPTCLGFGTVIDKGAT